MKRKIWNLNMLIAIGLIVCGVVLSFVFALETETKAPAAQPRLQFHTESVEALLEWFDNGAPTGAIPALALLPANRFMEQLLLHKEAGGASFAGALAAFAEDRTHRDYLLAAAYARRKQVAALAQAVTDPAVAAEAWQCVAGYFPPEFHAGQLPAYEVWLTATGWPWGDAMMFSYNPENYEIGEHGKPAIIFNLTLIDSLYGEGLPQQLSRFQSVLKHELFHAMLADYRASKQIPKPQTIEELTHYMLYNEGLAHYLADAEMFREGDAWKEKEEAAFKRYSEQRQVLFDSSQPDEARMAALQEGLQGPYWDKYICITGLFMAAHIDRQGSRELLRECIARGPAYFVEAYQKSAPNNRENE